MPQSESERILAKLAEHYGDDTLAGENSNNLKMLSALAQMLREARLQTEKAYGGCHNCYGKGYATFKTQHIGYGTDGDIGGYEGPYKRDMPVGMKLCTCERGKQLKAALSKPEGGES
jgi:hypothetical protein